MSSDKSLSEKRSEAGRKGGQATAVYGPEFMAALGAMGGRPTFLQAVEKARSSARATAARSRPGRKKKEA